MLLFALLQAAASPEWGTLGIGGGIAALVVGFWRVERKESQERYERLAKESQERYAVLAEDFRKIVEDNTRALTELSVAIHTDNAANVRQLVNALRGKGEEVPMAKGGAG